MTHIKLTRFTKPSVLMAIGHRHLAKFFEQFKEDFKARNIQLPGCDPCAENYYTAWAELLGRPETLPHSLVDALLAIEDLAAPANWPRLEAAVYAKPVVFGRNYKKYQEAIDLLDHEGAKTFSDSEELYQILSTLLNDEDDYRLKCQASRTYVEKNVGATQKILNYIEENRLLTS